MLCLILIYLKHKPTYLYVSEAINSNSYFSFLEVDVCILPVMGRNITVDGLPEDDARIQSGHTLQFRCNNPEFSLVGPNEITCNENGEWSGQFSNCVGKILNVCSLMKSLF